MPFELAFSGCFVSCSVPQYQNQWNQIQVEVHIIIQLLFSELRFLELVTLRNWRALKLNVSVYNEKNDFALFIKIE